MTCPLCEMQKITEWKLVVCRCSTHPDKWMIILGRHTAKPTAMELAQIMAIAKILFPEKEFRSPASILDHFHLHEV